MKNKSIIMVLSLIFLTSRCENPERQAQTKIEKTTPDFIIENNLEKVSWYVRARRNSEYERITVHVGPSANFFEDGYRFGIGRAHWHPFDDMSTPVENFKAEAKEAFFSTKPRAFKQFCEDVDKAYAKAFPYAWIHYKPIFWATTILYIFQKLSR